ncbi:hypothetical protein [Limobrevibacterium gyesilva]|uniref:Uncharacterized protein n=1 Tax=Limobrevibacterium gyesilva TaxID=2991712 RepID=A0AA41YVQ4_9PROT|nr:hypothetical protein [Limobrevibacterium gyesilva]MCW3477383.1 hypothetical protein [Limobrevibacterium gyesilva]
MPTHRDQILALLRLALEPGGATLHSVMKIGPVAAVALGLDPSPEASWITNPGAPVADAHIIAAAERLLAATDLAGRDADAEIDWNPPQIHVDVDGNPT